MTERVARLRERSVGAEPAISAERARLLTDFYREHDGDHSPPVMRALAFHDLCANKTVYIDPDELIVGERGPAPKATPTYPELTCHSIEDLRILDSREKTSYAVSDDVVEVYERNVIPFWKGRSLRDRIFDQLSDRWKEAYSAGIFTEFMEQRAPGHTVADGKLYRKGMQGFRADIAAAAERLGQSEEDPRNPLGLSPAELLEHRREQLRAMDIAADAVILYAQRHAELAARMAESETDAARRDSLRLIADTCARVPADAPRTFHEALQSYWFCHLGVITELNGWDAFNPGHLDQHLEPFYRRGVEEGSLTSEAAKELLECFFIKFNNQLAPPKVGVTAAESGTYTDFANINIGGLTRDGADGSSDVSYLILEVVDELHTLQPSQNVQISRQTPDDLLREACRVIRKGYGYPSVFNADAVVEELVRQGKSAEDAREGGTSGCVEAGAFGKEAYILTGYFNLPKVLELALNDGVDPVTGVQLGPTTGDPSTFESLDRLMGAFGTQLHHFIEIKLAGNAIIERMYAEEMPAPFLSLITDDCIAHGLDYNEGGARYNTSYIQGVGIGTITDSLAAMREHVYHGRVTMEELTAALAADFEGHEPLRSLLVNRSPKWGNDDDRADELMNLVFEAFHRAVDGRPNVRGGQYHIDMLPTTCHIYFGSITGATPDGRKARAPLSEGISPVQGTDRKGPTAVLNSASKMDHSRTGGTLLNMKFAPEALSEERDLKNLAALIRGYFRKGGHHIQFNVVSAETLRDAQAHPERHRDLLVRVAGYSDYFTDISRELQDEIISRTEQARE